MIDEEKNFRFVKRNCKGDASETGIVRFITPALMTEYGGNIDMTKSKADNALEHLREDFPIMKDPAGINFEVPFNSAIKFNLIVRDMNVNV